MSKNSKALVEKEPEGTIMGRPTLYRDEFTHQARVLCARGATDSDLADFFDVTPRTINRWKVLHPEFLDAIRRGKEPADDRVEDSLYHRAQNREVEEEQAIKVKKIVYGSDGKKIQEEEEVKIVTVKKFVPADTTAMIFWLKNRRAKDWRDVHKHEHGKAGDFDQLDDSELDNIIDAEVTALGYYPTPEEAPPQKLKPKPQRGRATKH